MTCRDRYEVCCERALLTGHASADQVAALFSIHSRTLSRRLHAFGTNFQELVDEGRFEIARQMLEDSRMEVSQIAMALDYADASAFTRAFRRWSGTTPAQWRENQNGGEPAQAVNFSTNRAADCRINPRARSPAADKTSAR